MSDSDRTYGQRGERSGNSGCMVVALLLILLLGVGVVGGGFFFYQARRRAIIEMEKAERAQMEAMRGEAHRREREQMELRDRQEALKERQQAEAERRMRRGQPEAEMDRSPARPRGAFPTELVRVLSGDALVLRIEGNETQVRMIGIVAPAAGESGQQESADALKAFVEKGPLYAAPDADVDPKDEQGRRRYWVWANERLLNLEQLRQGYAKLAPEHGLGRYEQELRAAAR